MNMLVEELQLLSSNPWAWGVVAIMAIFSLQSIFVLLKCPVAAGTVKPTPEQIAEAQNIPDTPGPRFAITMLCGAALTLIGLFLIANGIRPAIALGAVVIGIVLIQTEPSRLLIREQTARVIAEHREPELVLFGHRDRLRGSHRNLVIMNLALLTAVVLGMLAF